MGNPFVHIELQTQDLEKSKKFYAGMLDWKLEELPDIGWFSVITDPTGATFGLWQPKAMK